MTTLATVRGGSWLIEETPVESVFTPEQLSEEHRLIGQTADEFVSHEVQPALERLEQKDWQLANDLVRRAGELGLLGTDVSDDFGGVGLDNTYALMETYDRAIQLLYKTWQYHFEFLNLGYAAYLDFFGFLKSQFPAIPDQAIAKMVQGVDVDLFRPDDELKKLAKLAVKLGVAPALREKSVDAALAAVSKMPNGRQWLDAWKAAHNPWALSAETLPFTARMIERKIQ